MEKTKAFEGWTVQLYDNARWYEKLALYFRPFKTHLSADGFVLYKVIHHRMYVYVHGHFVLDEQDRQEYWDGGASKHWTN